MYTSTLLPHYGKPTPALQRRAGHITHTSSPLRHTPTPLRNSCTKLTHPHYAPSLTKYTHLGLIHSISALHFPPTSFHSCVTYNATLSPLCGTPNTHLYHDATHTITRHLPTLPLPLLATLARTPPAHGSYESVTHAHLASTMVDTHVTTHRLTEGKSDTDPSTSHTSHNQTH